MYTISEKKALKRLGITDFRHMTKDKIVPFLTMAPHMDPEVAKAAIAQFPEFKDMAVEMTNALKDIVNKAFDSEKESQKYFYESCNGMLATLGEQLKDENIDAQERAQIRDNMMQIIAWISQKDSEHKQFIMNVIKTVTGGFSIVAGIAAVALGSKADLKLPEFLNKSSDNTDGNIKN